MKAVYFDWGGVIATDPGDDFLSNILLDTGATAAQVDQITRLYMEPFMKGQLTELDFWTKLRHDYHLTFDDSISDQFKHWSGLSANPHVLSLVDLAKKCGWQTGLLTNVIPPTYDLLKSAGYYDRFDAVIASCREGLAKPDSAIYDLALRRLGATPSQSIFIDDKQSNLHPAQAMGFTTVLAKTPQQVVEQVQALLKV